MNHRNVKFVQESKHIDVEQLNLFENTDIMSQDLKYPRRNVRSIGSKIFQLDAPNERISQTMQNIGSSNTSIEKIIERELLYRNINFSKPELLIGDLEGKPDFVIPRFKIAIFCDGDFWHGKEYVKGSIKRNSEFWDTKIENNVLRDEKVTYNLKQKEWKVFRFWEKDIKANPDICVDQIESYISAKSSEKNYVFTFVDLFAGIGGFRIALEELGGKCLGFSEIDKNAINIYKKNFWALNNDDEKELGDITKLSKLPFENIDLIVGGVPCQAWSVAGNMKGFEDPRGALWYDTIRLIKLNKPKVFVFENVKGLIDPRNKENLELIIENLESAGYHVKKPQLLNSYDFGLPQNRDRIFIVGVRKDIESQFKKFSYPQPISNKHFLKEIISGIEENNLIHDKVLNPELIHGDKIPRGRNRFQYLDRLNEFFIFCDTRNGHTTIHSWDIYKTTKREKEICMIILKNRRKKIYGNSDGNPLSFKVLSSLIEDLKLNELELLVSKKILRKVSDKGYEFVNSKNSSGINNIYRVYLPHSNIFSTLTATGSKDHIALIDVHAKDPKEYKLKFINEVIKKKLHRPITAKEAGMLQGFPNWFSIHKDEKIAKKQFGNAVSTLVVLNLIKSILATNIFNKNDGTRKVRNN